MEKTINTVKPVAEDSSVNKIFAFFSNKWTKFAFSFVSLFYLVYLGVVAWLTFGYHFVFDNAAAVFFLYAFANVMFAIAMIYTRKCMITKVATLFMHPFILIILIYGFGNYFLILPPFIAATVIFFASGGSESIKVILGTVYMIMFVLTFFGYVTLESLTIGVPLKMDLQSRDYPQTVEYEGGKTGNFRLVAYIDPESKANRRADFYIEPTDKDLRFWNLTCEKVSKSVEERAGTLTYCENMFGGTGKPRHKLKWDFTGKANMLYFNELPIEVDENGRRILEEADEYDEPAATLSPTAVTGRNRD